MLSRLRSYYRTDDEDISSNIPASTEPPLQQLKKYQESGPEDSDSFITDPTLERYLSARQSDPKKSYDMLSATLLWRASYQPSKIYNQYREQMREQAATGKMFVLPVLDSHNRAIIVMRPGLENSNDHAAKMRYLVYTLERASRLADSRFVVFIDYRAGKISMSNTPGLSAMKEVLGILQGHYPERFGLALMFDAPKFFLTSFKILKPFIDPVTKEKIVFISEGEDWTKWSEQINPQAVPKAYGGELDYTFDVNEYFEQDEQLLKEE